MSKHLTFKPESSARNVWVNENGSEELDEYTVPTKQNRGSYAMSHPQFNASDPQSSAVRLGRSVNEYMWNPEYSAANTYTREESESSAKHNRHNMKTKYGDSWVNATIRREEAEEKFDLNKGRAKQNRNATLKNINRRYREQLGRLPKNIAFNAATASRSLRTMRLSRANFTRRLANIKASRNAALAQIPREELAAYERDIEDAQNEYSRRLNAIEEEYQNVRHIGFLSKREQAAINQKRHTRVPLANRLAEAAIRADLAEATYR